MRLRDIEIEKDLKRQVGKIACCISLEPEIIARVREIASEKRVRRSALVNSILRITLLEK
jgi:hypothetical protein